MVWVVYFLFTALSAVGLALLLAGGLEPLAKLLARRPLPVELAICFVIPFVAAIVLELGFALYVLAVRRGPDEGLAFAGLGAAIMQISGFIGGAALGLLLLLGRWHRHVMVTITVIAASLAWCLAGVEMFYVFEEVLAVLTPVAWEVLFGGPHPASDYTHGHAVLAGLVVAGVSLLTACGIWRWQDRCAAIRSGKQSPDR